jgi:soluble lytic murein transglycosylase-like protein
VTSPATTSTAPAEVNRRSRKPFRLAAGLLVVIGVALATTACTPEMIAKDAIHEAWGDKNSPCAEKIVERESGYQADAVNRSSGATGLFQLMPLHAKWIKANYGYDWDEMKDPYKNAEVAAGLSHEAWKLYGDGWQPWRMSSRAVPGGGCPA